MDAALGLGGGDALHAVHAALVFEHAIDFLARDVESDVFVAAGGAFVEIDDFHFPVLLFTVARIHAEKVAGKDAGLVAARAAAYLDHGVLAVGGVGGDEHDTDVLFHLVTSLGAFGKFLLGHLAQLFVFLSTEQFLALCNIVKQCLVVVIGFHHRLQVFVVFAQFYVTLHVRRYLRVVHLLFYLLIT